jgi:hypothetical protein
MPSTWLLLIYTVPAEPSRKRAAVWREVKKLGAVYLRDGVCILPERPDTLAALRALAQRIEQLDGQASLVQGAQLDRERAAAVIEQFQAARANEYAEIVREAELLLAHIARETEHRDFTFAELEELEQDLAKLRRWTDQVRARDYFSQGPDAALVALLERCEQALEAFMEQAQQAEQPAEVD